MQTLISQQVLTNSHLSDAQRTAQGLQNAVTDVVAALWDIRDHTLPRWLGGVEDAVVTVAAKVIDLTHVLAPVAAPAGTASGKAGGQIGGDTFIFHLEDAVLATDSATFQKQIVDMVNSAQAAAAKRNTLLQGQTPHYG